jgi:hypothetical protein
MSSSAADIAEVERTLPRSYDGEFRWVGDRTTQKVRIKLNLIKRLDASRLEAIGCGRYEVLDRITDIGVQIRIDTPNLDVEIREFSPSGTGARIFVTDGSHKGRLSEDLQTIKAEWVTLTTGQRGLLQLQASPAVDCAGDQASVFPDRPVLPSVAELLVP